MRDSYPLLCVLLSVLSIDCTLSGGTIADASSTDARDPNDPDPVITTEQWAALQLLSPIELPAPAVDPTNRVADLTAAVVLGQRLFYDPGFSGPLLDSDNDGQPPSLGNRGDTGRVACASCHLPESGFSDTRSFQAQISLGAGWGRRRAPSLLDIGHARLVMWDGRHDALYNQVFGPIESVVEMNSSRLYVAREIHQRYRAEYTAVFGPMPAFDDMQRFPVLSAALSGCQPANPSDPQPVCNGPFRGRPGDNAEFDGMTQDDQRAVTTVVVNMGKAIAAFERRLSCGASPFDAWVHGNGAAISRSAQRGAALFVGRGDCVRCHSGPFLSDQQFHNVGLMPQRVQQAFLDADDLGAARGIAEALVDPLNSLGIFSDGSDDRLPTSVAPMMLGAFRTPMLRCVAQRPSFMHTGQLRSLASAVSFFNTGGNTRGYPGTSEIHSLGLNTLEQGDLLAFLLSLTGPGAEARYRQSP